MERGASDEPDTASLASYALIAVVHASTNEEEQQHAVEVEEEEEEELRELTPSEKKDAIRSVEKQLEHARLYTGVVGVIGALVGGGIMLLGTQQIIAEKDATLVGVKREQKEANLQHEKEKDADMKEIEELKLAVAALQKEMHKERGEREREREERERERGERDAKLRAADLLRCYQSTLYKDRQTDWKNMWSDCGAKKNAYESELWRMHLNGGVSKDPQADLQKVKDEIQKIATSYGFTSEIDYFEVIAVNRARNNEHHYEYSSVDGRVKFLELCKTTDWILTKCDIACSMETLIDLIANGEAIEDSSEEECPTGLPQQRSHEGSFFTKPNSPESSGSTSEWAENF